MKQRFSGAVFTEHSCTGGLLISEDIFMGKRVHRVGLVPFKP